MITTNFRVLSLVLMCANILTQSSVFAEAPNETSEVRYSQNGQQERGRRKTPAEIYKSRIDESIIVSTPFEQQSGYAEHHQTTRVSFSVDELGRVSDWRLSESSGSIARDFWTLYATASCPPMKPPIEIKTPLALEVVNVRLAALIPSQEAIDKRIEQSWVISRNLGAKNIFFCLIPASFVQTFPNTVSILDITARDNLVGIPISRLCTDSKKWTCASFNKTIKQSEDVNGLLKEWSQFFKQNSTPSRTSINQFAANIKAKYKTLLITEGEPQAPIP